MSKLLEDVREDPRREVGKFRPDLGLIVLGNSYRAWRRFCTRSWLTDGMFCPPEPDLLSPVGVPQPDPSPPIVQRLKEWRSRNHLSRRQAAAVLQGYGCPVSASAIKSWESGFRPPRELMEKALAEALEAHPTVIDPPRFGRWV